MTAMAGPHQYVPDQRTKFKWCRVCGAPERHANHNSAPERDDKASVPYGNVLTSLEGLTFTHSKPEDSGPRYAYVTNNLGEQVYIFASDNLYLTHAEPLSQHQQVKDAG